VRQEKLHSDGCKDAYLPQCPKEIRNRK
jgi:hypothetical protein